jgi:DNA-binding NtrC family response regulator
MNQTPGINKPDALEMEDDNQSICISADQENHLSMSAVCRLRLLIEELIREVELIDYGHSPSVEIRLQETSDNINFYEEVSRFEIAMIKTALHRTHGNQRLAARFLNLSSSTLNDKVKLYDIRPALGTLRRPE